MFPRVKAPAAYVRVPCYPPARVSNFVKDFLAGAYHWTSKVSKNFLVFVGGEARLWEGCSKSPYVLGILWFCMVGQCYGLMSEILYIGIPAYHWTRKVFSRKEYLKKWEGTLLVYSVFNTNNKTIYIFTQETNWLKQKCQNKRKKSERRIKTTNE